MRVPVKLLGCIFWLFFFNCAQSQECFRKDIKYENTEPAAKASYSDGETVKLYCRTGFTGMYRLKCEEGTWDTIAERKCAKKKCSHPGDAPNGDFKLTAGSEFVFGATVLYTCKKGFEMTSRINQRTCRAQGWDNTVPVCEAVKCPAIRTNADVTASGNTEEGNYGDVIHFECVSADKKIDGSSDIHCTETGEWSDSVPTCKEITCTAPAISNGFVVEPEEEYQRNAILKYRCSKGFKAREGIPRCAKFGWTLNPECDEVTCELKSTRFGVKKINPEGKTIFRAEESVEITCTEKYWIIFTKEAIRSFTCQENGEWDHQPVCEVIRCEVPRDQQLHNPYSYFRGDMTLETKKSYSCISGYEKKATVATCTREGWTPKPLCVEKMCAAPNIPNAEIFVGDQRQEYKINSRIQYKCRRGFEPEQPVYITCNSRTEWTGIRQCTAKPNMCPALSVENGFIQEGRNEEEIFYSCDTDYKPFSGNWWDSVTCSRGSWSEKPRCIREEECGAFPSVLHGKLKQTKQIFKDGETTTFECDPGFKPTQRFIRCDNGTWETPVCEVDVHCDIPPKVENAFITSKPEEFYGYGSSVTYVCQSSFLMKGKSTVFCRSETWEEAPTCKEATCPLNTTDEDLIMKRSPDIVGPVKPGDKLIFSCNREGLKLKGEREITCQSNGEWSSPFPKCEEVMCFANLKVNMRSDGHPGPEVSVRPGHTITLSCVGRELQGQSKIRCLSDGQWDVPFPKCIRGKCGPPPNVNFADTMEMTKRDYSSGERVEYTCFNKYTLVQSHPYSKYLTCEHGEWRGNIKCLKPCSVTVELMDERGIELRWRGREKIFSSHGDRITFRCKSGKYSVGSDLTQICNDGEMDLPRCV